jgi:hypothetical protein
VPLRPTAADEHLHEPAPVAGWTETYGFDFVRPDRSLAGFVVMSVHPSTRRSWCWAAVVGRDRPSCVVDEPEAPLPRRGAMELRAPALWVDVEIEIPFVHATVGMEAFGLAFDDPAEALRTGRGERTPLGLDLEWESDAADPDPHVAGEAEGAFGYGLDCRVTGEVLLGAERHELDCPGRRWHRWGDRPWWSGDTVLPPAPITWVGASVPFAGSAVTEVGAALGERGWTMARREPSGAAEMAP